jgi:hypothetical protein
MSFSFGSEKLAILLDLKLLYERKADTCYNKNSKTVIDPTPGQEQLVDRDAPRDEGNRADEQRP